MTSEERIAYLQRTLCTSPQGSARRMWAAAQLKALADGPDAQVRKGDKPHSNTGGRRS